MGSLSDIVVKATPGEWKVFDHYCGRDPETAGEEYANTRLIGLGQFDTIAEVRMGSEDVGGDFEANAQLFAMSKSLAALVLEAREALAAIARRAAPHPDDDDADRKRNLLHVIAIAQRTLAKLEAL